MLILQKLCKYYQTCYIIINEKTYICEVNYKSLFILKSNKQLKKHI